MEAMGAELEKLRGRSCDLRRLGMQLATGRISECPFTSDVVAEGRELIFTGLEFAGAKLPVREVPPNQPFFLAAIEELLRLSGDPDYKALYNSSASFAKGVRLGAGSELPRVPAVFERKEKWRTCPKENMDDQVRDNYISAKQQAKVVQEQFVEESMLGATVESSRTLSRSCGDITGRHREEGRVLPPDTRWNTRYINVNSRIRVRDQLRNSTGGDLRTLLRLMPGAFFAFNRALELALLVFVDDIFWLTREKGGIEQIVVSIFLFVILGLPFSWKKFAGGLQLSWVGFTIDLESCALGLSVGRATWAVNWLRGCVDRGSLRVADMSAVLGRLSFGLTALDHVRPFLGPIYAWVAALEHTRTYKLPKAVRLIMLFLAKALEGSGRLTPVRTGVPQPEAFRTDARAEGSEIWIEGWALDDPDTKKCRWFSEKLTHENAPWLYAAGESYRPIASLELLATLAAVMSFGVGSSGSCQVACSAGTDNRGNSFVVSRLLTTKFPLCAFLMELALQLHINKVDLELYWLPRLQNTEADSLTNDDASKFDTKFRVRFEARFRGPDTRRHAASWGRAVRRDQTVQGGQAHDPQQERGAEIVSTRGVFGQDAGVGAVGRPAASGRSALQAAQDQRQAGGGVDLEAAQGEVVSVAFCNAI
eukprot:s1590_g2.t1